MENRFDQACFRSWTYKSQNKIVFEHQENNAAFTWEVKWTHSAVSFHGGIWKCAFTWYKFYETHFTVFKFRNKFDYFHFIDMRKLSHFHCTWVLIPFFITDIKLIGGMKLSSHVNEQVLFQDTIFHATMKTHCIMSSLHFSCKRCLNVIPRLRM